jgi:hypothetical protein
MKGGGVLHEEWDLCAVLFGGGESEVSSTSSYMQVDVKPLPFEISEVPLNYELANGYSI